MLFDKANYIIAHQVDCAVKEDCILIKVICSKTDLFTLLVLYILRVQKQQKGKTYILVLTSSVSASVTTSYFLSKFVTKMLKIITMLPDA